MLSSRCQQSAFICIRQMLSARWLTCCLELTCMSAGAGHQQTASGVERHRGHGEARRIEEREGCDHRQRQNRIAPRTAGPERKLTPSIAIVPDSTGVFFSHLLMAEAAICKRQLSLHPMLLSLAMPALALMPLLVSHSLCAATWRADCHFCVLDGSKRYPQT